MFTTRISVVNVVMLGTRHSTADWVYFKTQTLLSILRTQNQPQEVSCGERTCVTCALTQGGLHTSCGIVLTIPTGRVDCYRWVVLWPMHSGFKGSKVALLSLCLFVGGKQKKVTKITITTRK